MKVLSRKNWQDIDPACEVFIHLDRNEGIAGPMFPEVWLRMVLAPTLDVGVPEDIRSMFEVARGAMLYGILFYPLFGLAREQCHRVADAALNVKYSELGGPLNNGRAPAMDARMRWLHKRSHATASQVDEWEWVRNLRNDLTHNTFPNAYPPAPAADALAETAHRINDLFAS
jgi:hypothetical protein